MSVQVAWLYKGQGTNAAGKRSLACMEEQVRLEVALVREGLRAEVALKRALSSVGTLVHEQM